jgi:hypothetical protein
LLHIEVQERAEVDAFLNAVLATRPMQYAHKVGG